MLTRIVICLLASMLLVLPASARDDMPEKDVLLKALVDELNRSMTLQLADLDKPYFVQYAVDDRVTHRISATYGAIVNSDKNQSRSFSSSVRVGSYDLDNTNFAGGGGGGFGRGRGGGRRGGGAAGGGSQLPIEDDYTAIRQALWGATDRAYKSAVETLAEKRAYMKDKNLEDRPKDFAEMKPIKLFEPRVALQVDRDDWEARLRKISGHFTKFDHILDAGANLVVTSRNRYLVSSEGSQVRRGEALAQLRVTASSQAADGERFSDGLVYSFETPQDYPGVESIIADVEELAANLARATSAPVLEDYVGPVLFDGVSSPQMFQQVMAGGFAATPESVGTQRRRRFRGGGSLERQLGKRVLPRVFNIYDDPRPLEYGSTFLLGHYLVDDEGVEAQRVDLVKKGVLTDLAMSRVPTQSLSESNGHGRGAGANVSAALGCLYVEADGGLDAEAMKAALIEAARDQDLEYGLRVTALGGGAAGGGGAANIRAMMQRFQRGGGGGGGGSSLADPLHIYRVYVADGREEAVRGCEFGPLDIRDMRDISAVGKTATVYNHAGGRAPACSIIAPAMLFEELELASIEEELERGPVIPAPHTRD